MLLVSVARRLGSEGPLGLGAGGLWLGLALGLAVVAIALGLRLQSCARLQIRATETIVLAAGGVRV